MDSRRASHLFGFPCHQVDVNLKKLVIQKCGAENKGKARIGSLKISNSTSQWMSDQLAGYYPLESMRLSPEVFVPRGEYCSGSQSAIKVCTSSRSITDFLKSSCSEQ